LLFVYSFFYLLTPSGYNSAIENLPNWYVQLSRIALYPIGIVSVVGIWKMRQWGSYLFFATIFIVIYLQYFELQQMPQQKAVFLLLLFSVVVFIYRDRFKPLGKLTKPIMLSIGFLTLWTSVYQIVSFVVVTTIYISKSLNLSPGIVSATTFVQAVKPLDLLLTMISLYLMVFYTFDVAKSHTLKKTDRIWFIVGIWILPTIVMPVYYVRYIWNTRSRNIYIELLGGSSG